MTDIALVQSAKAAAWRKWRNSAFPAAMLLTIVVLSLVGPHFSPYRYDIQDAANAYAPPSARHWFGTDEFGRDVLTRVIYGTRISLLVAVGAMLPSACLGLLLGGIAGYFGGLLDRVLTFFADIIWSFPVILIALLVITIVGPGLMSTMLAVGIAYVTQFIRLTRSQILSLKEESFIEATRALGAGDWRLLLLHMLPNALPAIIVAVVVSIAQAIVLEATLGFFGLGVQPPVPSWGSMMSSGTATLFLAPWVIIVPGIAIIFTVLAFSTFGDRLIRLLDTKDKG